MSEFCVLCFFLLSFYFQLKALVLDTDNAEFFEIRLAILQAGLYIIISFVLLFQNT